MKQSYFLIVCMLLCSISYGQSYNKDNSIVTLKMGYVQNGVGISGEYTFLPNQNGRIIGDILVALSEDRVTEFNVRVPYSSFYLNGGYYHNIYESYRGYFLLNGGGGISGGYQILNKGDRELSTGAIITSDSKFVYGVFVGVNADVFLTNSFKATLSIKEYHHVNSDIGKFFPYVGLGLSYVLY